jgi:hypothetical protein
MGKAITGMLLGAAVYFAASALSWMALPWMNHGLKKLPEETLIRDTMKVVVKESGAYIFPSDKTENGRMDDKTFIELFKSGPAGLLFYQAPGPEPMSAKNFVWSAIVALGSSAFCMFLLMLIRGQVASFAGRWGVVLLVGIFAWFNTLIPLSNWMFVPGSFVGTILLDTLVAFGLMGLVLVKFVPAESQL